MTKFFSFLVLLLAVGSAAAEPSVTEILARNKLASGGQHWDTARYLRWQGQAEASGLKGTINSVVDVRTGWFADDFVLGVYKGANGFDGKTVWEVDTSGQIIIQNSDEQKQAAVNEAYRRSQSYWYPNRMKAKLTAIGVKVGNGHRFHGVRAEPEGGRPFEMWFSEQTSLLDHYSERVSQEMRTTHLAEYRDVQGLQIPFYSRQTNGDAKFDTIVKLQSVSLEQQIAPLAFSPPPPPKRDFGLLGQKANTIIPFKLINNHMYLEVRLNGRPYQFLFDTGGLNVITPTVARELGLKVEGSVQARGTGENAQEASFTKVQRYEIGDAWLQDQTFVVIGLESFSAIEGMPITGIVGYEIFKRFIVVTDYQNSKIVLCEPKGFSYRGAGKRVPININERTPEVEGSIDAIPGKFTLDTGARSSLSLSTPFVEKHALVSKYSAKYKGVTGWGVGGPALSWVVRAREFNLGGIKIPSVVTELSQNKSGSLASTYVAGNVGAGVLKRFNIVWDYENHQIFMEPNANYSQVDVFDRAGFWINAAADHFVVVDVPSGGAAFEAGLKPGDKIMKVNGKRAISEVSLPEFRLWKLQNPGTRLKLEVLRGGQVIPIEITLRDVV